ncbi:tyrosine-type recombinase/integrase [Prevotella copri]|uniref:Tyrosine-type recombinase/integrase n=1 Tax=Segatella copri TaxID=165179 RepID=A0AAW4N6N2_9BACT|nr:tyrosine-type recombinase/integrase [Segatella copri]MBV3398395.1 tyrosine-type recombinase/integrase [Segatella copri]MBV3402660.1 tyrosine-type recombinase/integrase [Segatella copri]MBV3407969.1 tyrosine-type recombinase/integrase [Segatella copri]MBV3410770.1 tyrosine-type recombinase/integrase [Segatella copri]
MTLEAGVPMETICKMLGHKDVKMTQRYARVTQRKRILRFTCHNVVFFHLHVSSK